ncbi:MAG: prepilin-type N-terminal cleavage/methylation domain-containing protein, partial [Candidatus Zambryskibacteria bacterium]|nr:prepilin-type N-terminal cleavage/methylation domain-containing protein [Candidatus Zambryskibacteria bacterium]
MHNMKINIKKIRNFGFTLIELLVVISIIAVIA